MTAATDRRTFNSSLASIGLHLVVALSIPALAWTPTSTPLVETISFMHVTHIEVLPKRPPHPPPQARAAHFRETPVVNRSTRVELAHTTQRRKASPPPAIARPESGAPVIAADVRAGEKVGAGDAAPQATATPAAREVASVGIHRDGGNLPFGAEQPVPVLDPGILKQLAALGVHVTLVVTVGDDGKTKNVAFQPPVDPQIEAKIESMLADASWDPAVCGGGIACEGQATIKL